MSNMRTISDGKEAVGVITSDGKTQEAVVYRHYKGNRYVVITEATHTETGELFVIYHREDGTPGVWARPYEMFHGYTESGIKRFERIYESATGVPLCPKCRKPTVTNGQYCSVECATGGDAE